MGSGSSSRRGSKSGTGGENAAQNANTNNPPIKSNENINIAHFMHPMFTLDDTKLSPEHVQLCQSSFDRITSGNYPTFQQSAALQGPENQEDPLVFVVHDFYQTLMDRIPAARTLFQISITSQAELLGRMIGTVLSLVGQQKEVCERLLKDMAYAHNTYGVHPAFYGEFAYTFICTLRKHIGIYFTPEINQAWVVLFSYMLNVMVPVSAKGEHVSSAQSFITLPSQGSTSPIEMGAVRQVIQNSNLSAGSHISVT